MGAHVFGFSRNLGDVSAMLERARNHFHVMCTACAAIANIVSSGMSAGYLGLSRDLYDLSVM